MDEKSLPSKLTRASSEYGDLTAIRAIIQLIPYIGGSLDTLLSSGGQKWKMERAEHFFASIEERMSALHTPPNLKDLATSEELHDLVHYSLEQVVKTRSADKRRRFANLICRQIEEPVKWEDPEAAARLLADLAETDLLVLNLVATAPPCGAPFDNLRVVELEPVPPKANKIPGDTFKPIQLVGTLPQLSRAALHRCCSELLAKGLIKDEGVSRYGGGAMRYFVATDSAYWFLAWIKG